MYKLFITAKKNQTIMSRKKEILDHKDEGIIAVIDDSKNYFIKDWLHFEFPLYSEGINRIELLNDNSSLKDLYKEAYKRESSFYHNDLWHVDESLKEHNDRIRLSLKDCSEITNDIVLFHDFGKPLVSMINPNDNKQLCYFNHENIGVIDMLTYMSSNDIEKYYNALVVANYHMCFINEQFEKKNRPYVFDLLIKDNKYSLVETFSKADKILNPKSILNKGE